jgi:hypothetical protein
MPRRPSSKVRQGESKDMPEDGQVAVQEAPVSQETVAPVQAVAPAPATSSYDESKIADMVKAEVAKATEVAKRELQSVKDKAAAEISRHAQRASASDATLRAVTGKLRELDPATATEVELAQLRSEASERTRSEQAEQIQHQQQEAWTRFQADIIEEITEMGVDPQDPKLDTGAGSKDWGELHKRVIKSAAKIKKEQETKMASQSDEVKQLRDQIAKLERQINGEANSVDTSTSSATAVKGIPTDSKKLGEWIANNPDEYRKRRQEVYDLQRKGLIH